VTVTLAAAYHDPESTVLDRLVETLPGALAHFDAAVVQASHETPAHVLDRFVALGCAVRHVPWPSRDVDLVGRARREVVAAAAALDRDAHVVYSDVDHVARWSVTNDAELAATVATMTRHAFTVVGRSEASLAAMPATLRETEAIVNRVFTTATGREWDLCSGVRAMAPDLAAAVVCDDEDTIANDVTWPLTALATTADVAYTRADGWRYEDDHRFANGEGDDRWRERIEADPQQWARRMRIAALMAAAIARRCPGRR
jgi:hypothetical protein